MANLRVYKRGKTWMYSFEAGKVNGKRCAITKGGFKKKKDAEIAGTKAKNEYDNCGLRITPTELTVSDYLELWLENICKNTVKAITSTSRTWRTNKICSRAPRP